MISSQRATEDALTLSRAVSGHGYQRVALTVGDKRVTLRVDSRLNSRNGDGWVEAVLHADDVTALRDWLNSQLGC